MIVCRAFTSTGISVTHKRTPTSTRQGARSAQWTPSSHSQLLDLLWIASIVRLSQVHILKVHPEPISVATLLPRSSSSSSLRLGKMLVVLRDGRKLQGVLRSYDQFGEHIHLPNRLDAATLTSHRVRQRILSSRIPSSGYITRTPSRKLGEDCS